MAVEIEETVVTDIPLLAGYMAEFDTVDAILAAAEKVRDAGYSCWDVHTPFPVHGIDEAMGIRPTVLPWLVLGGGLTGLVGALALQWFCNAFDYPFLISGKPLLSVPAWIPVTFELTILCSALTTVFGMLLLNNLPHLYNPLFKNDRFRRVTDDRFFVVIESVDAVFDERETYNFLGTLGPLSIEAVYD